MYNLEEYYGKYRDPVRETVVRWIHSQKVTEKELLSLYAEIIKTQTSQYRTPPDVAIMLPMLRQIQAEAEHERLADMTRLALPDASEVVDRDTQDRFMEALNNAIKEGRAPKHDETVNEILKDLGVSNQVAE